MTTTLTISAPLAMAAVPTLLAIGGVVVGVALRGYLTTGIEVARLNAVNDARTARWLWKRGYRKTPEAGPDLTEATPELPALPAHPHVEESAPDRTGMWRVLLGLASDLVDRAHDWLPNLLRRRAERNLIGSGEQATAEDPFAELLTQTQAAPLALDAAVEQALDEQRAEWVAANPSPYIGRHWNPGTQHTDIFPIVNPSIPTQRGGDADV